MLIKQIEDLKPPAGYKPIYQTSEKPVDSVLRMVPYSELKALAYDSILQKLEVNASFSDSISTLPASAISTSLLGIDDRNFPDSIFLKIGVKDERGFFVQGLAGPDRRKVITGKDSIWRLLIDSCGANPGQIGLSRYTIREINEDSRKPIAISMVLDHSPSMGEMRARKLQEAVRNTMDMLTDEDAISVIKFTAKIHREIPLISDYETYTSQLNIDGLRGESAIPIRVTFNADTIVEQGYGGGTAIYDGAIAGIEEEFPFVLADIVKSMKNHYVISYAPPISADIHRIFGIVSLRKDLVSSFRGTYDKSILHAWDAIGTMHSALIEFEKGSSAIPASANQVLQDVFYSLKSSPNITLEIRGHTDDIGKEEDNAQLSLSRAQSVAGALIAKGIKQSRLIITGKGESMPLIPNDSEDSRKKNRRTEFIIKQK